MQSAIEVSASQLQALQGPSLRFHAGNLEARAVGIGTPTGLKPSQLAFVSNRDFLAPALEKASILILEQKLLPPTLNVGDHQALFTTPSLKAAMVLVLPLFDPRQKIKDELISSRAFVHPTAQVGAGTRVAAQAFIGAHAVVGKDCDIRSGAVIEAFCQVGDRCVIHANATIGADGYGFVTDPQGHHDKVPQIGIVVLEDDVEIGANTAIDRATLGETRIGQGTKFDNLCHVAHNCQIGRHCLFTAGFIIAGSSTIGDHFMCGGGCVVVDHVHVCERVTLGGWSAITKDIIKPGAYAGYPLEPLRDGLKTTQNLVHLTRMRRQLHDIAKRLGMGQDSE